MQYLQNDVWEVPPVSTRCCITSMQGFLHRELKWEADTFPDSVLWWGQKLMLIMACKTAKSRDAREEPQSAQWRRYQPCFSRSQLSKINEVEMTNRLLCLISVQTAFRVSGICLWSLTYTLNGNNNGVKCISFQGRVDAVYDTSKAEPRGWNESKKIQKRQASLMWK